MKIGQDVNGLRYRPLRLGKEKMFEKYLTI